MSERTVVRVGQVWADNDKRMQGRTLRVVNMDTRFAYCQELTGVGGGSSTKEYFVRIAIDRMKPTSSGYRLVGDEL